MVAPGYTAISEDCRHQFSTLPVPLKLEVVYGVETLADRPARCIGVKQEIDCCKFVFAVYAIFSLPIWPEITVEHTDSPPPRVSVHVGLLDPDHAKCLMTST